MNIQNNSYLHLLPIGIRASVINDFDLLVREQASYRRVKSFVTPAELEEFVGNYLEDRFGVRANEAYLMGNAVTGYIFHPDDQKAGDPYPFLIVRTSVGLGSWFVYQFVDDMFVEV